jgi:hypothetical protein
MFLNYLDFSLFKMSCRGKINKNKSQNKAKVALIISNLNVLWEKGEVTFCHQRACLSTN